MKRSLAIALALVAMGFVVLGRTAHAQLASNEAFSICTSTLCIDSPLDGPNGDDGSGGWGWDTVTNAPVTSLKVDQSYPFTVTVLQPNTPWCGTSATMTITLQYSSRDFHQKVTVDSRGNRPTNPFDRGGIAIYSDTGDFLCRTDQSVAYTFFTQHATNTALITATVAVDGVQASETFPVAIVK